MNSVAMFLGLSAYSLCSPEAVEPPDMTQGQTQKLSTITRTKVKSYIGASSHSTRRFAPVNQCNQIHHERMTNE